MSKITKKDLLKNCQTGDILLYNGTTWLGKVIEYFTGSNYSHVAIILRDPIYIDPKLKGLYVLESGEENIPDSLTGKKILGVQITPLANTLDYFKNSWTASLYHRQLDCNRDNKFEEKLKELVNKTEGEPYDLCIFDWFRAKFDIEIGNVQITKRFWCSALIAYLYVELGFLDKDLPWSMIEPRQFSYYENKRLSYKDCIVAPEKQITNI